METPPAGEPTQERVMYYSASWQLLEERITDDLLVEAPAEPEVNRHMQYIWGNRSIDDIALRRQNHNFGNDSPDVTYEDTRYHLTDALFSTVVITNQAGAISERVSYSPYGKARHHRTADLNGNGGVDSADQLLLFNAWGDGFFADLNRDGTVDSADLLILSTNWGAAESPGRLSVTDNTIGFAGYVFNAEFDDAGLYTVRYRPYEPELGRWLSRDPLGYVDGMGVYEYVRGMPTIRRDSFGLESDECRATCDQCQPVQEYIACMVGCRNGGTDCDACRRFRGSERDWCITGCRSRGGTPPRVVPCPPNQVWRCTTWDNICITERRDRCYSEYEQCIAGIGEGIIVGSITSCLAKCEQYKPPHGAPWQFVLCRATCIFSGLVLSTPGFTEEAGRLINCGLTYLSCDARANSGRDCCSRWRCVPRTPPYFHY